MGKRKANFEREQVIRKKSKISRNTAKLKRTAKGPNAGMRLHDTMHGR